jgi:hypothetical protein
MIMKFSVFVFIAFALGSLPLYGFGILVAINEEIVSQNNTIIKILEKQSHSGNLLRQRILIE